MTRTQFLIVLYKKLLRPALLMLAAWFAVMIVMIIADITGSITKEGYWSIATYVAYIVGITLLLLILQKTVDLIVKKFQVDTTSETYLKTTKAMGRIADIALGMVILYVWQENSAAAIGMIISIVWGMFENKDRKEEASTTTPSPDPKTAFRS